MRTLLWFKVSGKSGILYFHIWSRGSRYYLTIKEALGDYRVTHRCNDATEALHLACDLAA